MVLSRREVFKLMQRKGVYPYEYMDSWERFEETRLPPREAFYSNLNMEGISDKDYEHAQQVWNIIDEKTLGEYHDIYLKTDVLLLADIFENFQIHVFRTLMSWILHTSTQHLG